MPNKNYFSYELIVYLKDINMFGGTYFSRYFEWQGMCREAYYLQVKDCQEILAAGINLITRKASMEYFAPVRVFDCIFIKVQNKNIKKCSFEMVFTMINKKTNVVVGRAEQLLTFSDINGKVTRIPQGILNVIKQHEIK